MASLLLLLGTAGLWVDSYWSYSQFLLLEFEGSHLASLYSRSGALLIGVSSESIGSHFLIEFGRFQPGLVERLDAERMGVLDFGFEHYYRRGGWNLNMVLPHWFLVLIFAVLPGIWLYLWKKLRKVDPNACPGCGYDLTGNESGVCPECGVGV